ncbi:hypothetical protein J6590_046542 [Homalodisca vitripennis]|nr:hypothetical protein J6590_046542 [Homalodisca vitripennis]
MDPVLAAAKPAVLYSVAAVTMTTLTHCPHLKVTSEAPKMAGEADCLQGQDRSAVTHPNSSHAGRCLIWLSCDNRRIRYTAPLATRMQYKSKGIR